MANEFQSHLEKKLTAFTIACDFLIPYSQAPGNFSKKKQLGITKSPIISGDWKLCGLIRISPEIDEDKGVQWGNPLERNWHFWQQRSNQLNVIERLELAKIVLVQMQKCKRKNCYFDINQKRINQTSIIPI